MTMPPFTEDPEASRPHFAALKRLAGEHGLAELSMGTSQDYRVAAEEGRRSCGWVPSSTVAGKSPHGANPSKRMAFRDTWHRTLVYFGLAEDRDPYDEEQADYREPEEELESRYRERPNVRRLSSRRRRDDIDDIFADDPGVRAAHGVLRSVGGSQPPPNGGRGRARAPHDPQVLQRRPGRRTSSRTRSR